MADALDPTVTEDGPLSSCLGVPEVVSLVVDWPMADVGRPT